MSVRITVDAVGVPARVDAYLGSQEVVGSRAEAQRLIDAGRVLVNGCAVAKRHQVRPGDVIEVDPLPRPAPTLAPESMALDVHYEDDHLIVVDKPAGIVTHPSRGHDTGTLVHGLLARGIAGGGEAFRPGIVHRLDRDTSGLLVVAKDERTHRRLQALLRDRVIDRRYQALVHGRFPPALAIEQPIGRDRRNRLRMSTSSDAPRDARTRVRTLTAYEEGLTLVEARLDTGRTHQIRVHLEWAGYPVVGDPTYGRGRAALGLGRQFLHAWRLDLPHPVSDEPLAFTSELPAELDAVLATLRPVSAPNR